jgi:sugar lactone lactonase YvrE
MFIQREVTSTMLVTRSEDRANESKLRLSLLRKVFTSLLLLGFAAPLWAQVTTTQSAVNFGTAAMGATTGITQSLSFTVPSGITLGGISAVTEGAANLDFTVAAGSTCASGTTSATCTVQIKFLPKAVGTRMGAAVLTDQSTPPNTLITVPLSGTGTGPLIAFAPGIITTMAGNHGLGVGYSGDGGLATSAQFSGPQVVSFDASGNLYIVDGGNNVIRKVTPGGVITTVLAHGGLDGYTGVAVDGAGDLFALNDTIWKMSPDGTITTVPGGGVGVMGIAVDGSGNLYIADRVNDVINKITPGGTITTVAGKGPCADPELDVCYSGDGGPATGAQLLGPWGVALDGSGNLYIADTGNSVIRKVTTGGTITTVAGKYEYVSSLPGPAAGYSGDGGPATSAQLSTPYSIALDGAGDLYIADTGNGLIRKVTPGGTITTVAGNYGLGQGYSGDGGPATGAQLASPRGVAVDAAGNLYIGDTGNNVVRKVDVSDAPSLSFANTDTGAASASQDVTVLNFGNAALTISPISTAANFTLGGSDTSCSSTTQTLSPAASCVLGIEFNPSAPGSVSGSVILTDNTQNARSATQTVALLGSSLATAATTTPSYTLAASSLSLTATAGGSTVGTLNLASKNYAGTVSFATSISSANGAVTGVTASASPITLTSGGNGTSTITITTTSAATHAPAAPWKNGIVMLCAVLLGAPFTLRRKHALAVLLTASAITIAGFSISCGGSSSSTASNAKPAVTYIVTVTPTGTGTVANPVPVSITVTVP